MSNIENARAAALAAIKQSENTILEAGRWIWNNPEPGYREVKTSAYIIEALKRGFEHFSQKVQKIFMAIG